MVNDEPVVREQLATFEEIENEAMDYALSVLISKGFIGAAHVLSLDYWGYGMEDSDDPAFLEQLEGDQARALQHATENP